MTIEGVNRTTKILADGSRKFYYYCFRGKDAPKFWECDHKPVKHPYPRAFVEAYELAMRSRITVKDDFDGLATQYLASPEYASCAKRTQADYRRYIDKARTKFGATPLQVIADPRFRRDLIDYRDSLKESRRTADLAIQACSLVLEHARNSGLLATNPAASIPNLYSAPGDKRPWTPAEIIAFSGGCPRHILDAFDLMRHLAVRREDAVRITWAADKGTHIAWGTSKGKRSGREAIIPILPEARRFLDDLKRRNMAHITGLVERKAKLGRAHTQFQFASSFMLVNQRGRQWKTAGSLTRAFRDRWLADILKYEGPMTEAPETPTPHRLRNNAATAYIIAELDDRTIADAMGWSPDDVEEMRRVYVDREAVVSAAVIRLRDRK